jgi:tetratricopeptide (TPR) repeat protein
VIIYAPGLDGPFLLDDNPNITKNEQVAITSLHFDQINQAWNASPLDFPHNRPLSMLTFGINHALCGFDPFWFKTTNLVIHLLCAFGLFFLTHYAGRLYSIVHQVPISDNRLNWWGLLATSIWLMHPLNLSPVLYVVQRMASLTTLFMILGMLAYCWARKRLLLGHGGKLIILVSVPVFTGLAFLSKENGAILPGYLFVMELCLFRFKCDKKIDQRFLQTFFLLTVILPAIVIMAFILFNPNWIVGGYSRRQFTLLERLLTESRVLWLYLQMVFTPAISLFGLYHDDFVISRGLLEPSTTLLAIAGLAGMLLLALVGIKKTPILSFGILFFLAGHSIESTIIPLELIYEHRNYLPDFALFFTLAYYLTATPKQRWQVYTTGIISIAFLGICSITTALRAQDWSSEPSMMIAEAKHHPNSPRANFRLGQLLISQLKNSQDLDKIYQLARSLFEKAVSLNPRNADGLFALIVLNLHAGKPLESHWIEELKYRLEHIPYDPQNITTAQFSYLVKWQISGGRELTRDDMLSIFDAVLRNPKLDKFAAAGIHSALRAYYHLVLQEPEPAIEHARLAVRHWPERWHYQQRLIELLVETGSLDEATAQLEKARQADKNGVNIGKANDLELMITTTYPQEQ